MADANAGTWAKIALRPAARCQTDIDFNQAAKPTSMPIYWLTAYLVANVLSWLPM